MKIRLLPLALAAIVLGVSSRASADPELFEAGRLQAGVITEGRPAVDRTNDFHIDAIPEIGVLWGTRRSQYSLTYTFTFALHTFYATEIGHRLAFQAAYELTPRTRLLAGANAARTTINNAFLSQPTAVGTIALLPNTSTEVLTAGVNQGLAHDLTPRIRLDQSLAGTAYYTLAPTPPLETFTATLGGGAEYFWTYDSLGIGALATVSTSRTIPPIPDQNFAVFTLAPRWRHDWSRAVTSLLEVGASVVETLDHKTDPLWGPYARGTVSYTIDDTTMDLVVATGLTPNPLTGQLVQATSVTLHGGTPISRHEGVYLTASMGYVKGSLLDRVNPDLDLAYDSVLSDVEVDWHFARHVGFFARYTFIGQKAEPTAAGLDGSFLRDSILFGVEISSRVSPDGRFGDAKGGGSGQPDVKTGFPKRVDGSDGLPPPAEKPPPIEVEHESPRRDDD